MLRVVFGVVIFVLKIVLGVFVDFFSTVSDFISVDAVSVDNVSNDVGRVEAGSAIDKSLLYTAG